MLLIELHARHGSCRVSSVLRHRIHTRIIRVAERVMLLPWYPIHAYAHTPLRMARLCSFTRHVSSHASWTSSIMLSKFWSVEQRKNMRRNRRTRGVRGWTVGLYTERFFHWPYLRDNVLRVSGRIARRASVQMSARSRKAKLLTYSCAFLLLSHRGLENHVVGKTSSTVTNRKQIIGSASRPLTTSVIDW